MEKEWKEFPNHEIKFKDSSTGEVVGTSKINEVTAEMRENHFNIHGTYSDDKTIAKAFEEMNSLEDTEFSTHNAYKRKVKSNVIDVYDVLKAFEVTNPAVQHAIKKLLAAGKRGYKDKMQDLKEAMQSVQRAIELEI